MTLRARFRFTWLLLALAAAAFTLLSSAPAANQRGPTPSLEFLGQEIIPTGTLFGGTQIGGLSSIAYDDRRDVFYVLSDDPSQFNPARFYTVHLAASDGSLDVGDIDFLAVTTLRDANGQPFAPFSLDPEGLALTDDDELVITSEGIATSSSTRSSPGST